MTLFTIGYEGRNIEEYLGLLKKNIVKLVIDVRRNPISRKRGFSKNRMREALSSEGIEYMHFPQLGIESKNRKSADSDNCANIPAAGNFTRGRCLYGMKAHHETKGTFCIVRGN